MCVIVVLYDCVTVVLVPLIPPTLPYTTLHYPTLARNDDLASSDPKVRRLRVISLMCVIVVLCVIV